ncbi:MAG: hypothetical protein O7G85_10185 [Planctomycetota bacterium]|nr:hypothetical protein [Planctomycetota bacterium]
MVYFLFGIGLVVGALLFAFGWRGRQIDDHPLCRGCRYDLSGTPSLPAKCPECGRDLARKRSTRLGHRRKRPIIISLAILLVLGFSGGLGGLSWSEAKGFDWNTVKPVWWLRHDTQGGDYGRSSRAWKELTNRMNSNVLEESLITQIIDGIIESVNQNPNANMMMYYSSEFFQAALQYGYVDDQAFKRLFGGKPKGTISVTCPTRIAVGDALPIEITSGPWTFAVVSLFIIHRSLVSDEIFVQPVGYQQDDRSPEKVSFKYLVHPTNTSAVKMQEEISVESSQPGFSRVILSIEIQIEITRIRQGESDRPDQVIRSEKWREDHVLDFEVVEGDEPD